jgi:hypothetical protein
VASSEHLPNHPDTSNDRILPNHITVPMGAEIVESNIEPRRQSCEGCRTKIYTSSQSIQIIHGAIVHNALIVHHQLSGLPNVSSYLSPTFDQHVFLRIGPDYPESYTIRLRPVVVWKGGHLDSGNQLGSRITDHRRTDRWVLTHLLAVILTQSRSGSKDVFLVPKTAIIPGLPNGIVPSHPAAGTEFLDAETGG